MEAELESETSSSSDTNENSGEWEPQTPLNHQWMLTKVAVHPTPSTNTAGNDDVSRDRTDNLARDKSDEFVHAPYMNTRLATRKQQRHHSHLNMDREMSDGSAAPTTAITQEHGRTTTNENESNDCVENTTHRFEDAGTSKQVRCLNHKPMANQNLQIVTPQIVPLFQKWKLET